MAESTARTTPLQTLSVKATTADINFKKRKVFNDPIHGQIELHPVCCRIIDTPQFQRLRDIKQLDTCYLVYPGASHNRFEHSIGVCYLAGKLLKTIHERQPKEDITKKDIMCVEIAGLCHDLGQGPFSHVFEKKFIPKMIPESSETFTHERIARYMFEFMLRTENGRLKNVIETELKECGIHDFNDDDYTFIFEMIDDPKDLDKSEWPYIGRSKDKSYMYEIVANKRNGIDVDKWDYLARDSYMLGMKVNVDYNRCFTSARVIKCNGVQGRNNIKIPERKQICYREKEAQDLYDMFYTRMTLHRRAYQHKTHKIIGMMICDALEFADEHLLIKGKRISETVYDMEAYTCLTDDVIQFIINTDIDDMCKILSLENKDKETIKKAREDMEQAQKILHDVMYRRLYKCVKQELCNNINITEKDVKDGISQHLETNDQIHMQQMFFHCDIVKFNYGMDDNNPMEKVRFYKKDNLDKALSIDKNQVSFILPDTFEESVIRIYCKIESDEGKETAANIVAAFDRWWKRSGFASQQGETGDETEPKHLTESNQTNPGQRAPEKPDDTVSNLVQNIKPLPEPASPASIKEPPPYEGENVVQRLPEEETADMGY